MGDVVSSHLDEAKREVVAARSSELMLAFGQLYQQQYAVALFNSIRFDVEGGGGPQAQLLQRKVPLENKSIFSGFLFHYLEENRKWRNRFLFVPDSYNINSYDSKSSHDKGQQPKGSINCAGYKVLTSLEAYTELLSDSLSGVKATAGSWAALKCATPFPLVLWHPYARHHFFCAATETEQKKWHAVLQDCIRHANDGLPEEDKVQTPAFTDAVRLYRQAQGHYGTWEMMCGVPSQILANLVMEQLQAELQGLIWPRLRGKGQERQRSWTLISDAAYRLVQAQCLHQYEELLHRCEEVRSSLEASIRTNMDQIITSKEHLSSKIKAVVAPKAEKLLKVSIQPYVGSVLEALMGPTSRGFSELRDLFSRELVDLSRSSLTEGTQEVLAQHMEKVSTLAFHPVKMQACYQQVERLSLEGLQQRFHVCSPAVFVQRAQVLMREQMDAAVYTFEQILHQSLEAQGTEDLCKTIQRCQDRVLKKFDYDSSSVRKRFFREALLQIFIPYMLKLLGPSCVCELSRFQEMIFEDFSRFLLVENLFEEVVLHSLMKDITTAVKEAAVQRRHNLFRDSIVLGSSDPSLHLLEEKTSVDWAGQYGGAEEQGGGGESQRRGRMKQVVSMVQVESSELRDTSSPDVSSGSVSEEHLRSPPEQQEEETAAGRVEEEEKRVEEEETSSQLEVEKTSQPAPPPAAEASSAPRVEETPVLPPPEETPVLPSREETPVLPPPEETPVLPSPEETPVLPSPEETPVLPPPEETLVLPAPEETLVLPPAEETLVLPPAEETPVLPPPEETPVLPPAEETPVLPPPEETPVLPAPEETPVLPPAEETPVLPAPEETPVLPPAEETPVLPPAEETPVLPAPEETPVLPPAEETPVLPAPEETPVVPPPEETPALPPAEETPVLPPAEETPVLPAPEETPVLPPAEETPVLPAPEETPVPPPPEETPVLPPAAHEAAAFSLPPVRGEGVRVQEPRLEEVEEEQRSSDGAALT